MQPAGGIIRRQGQLDAGDLQRVTPLTLMRGNIPTHLQHGGMILIGSGNMLQIRVCLGSAAQPEPANGGVEVMRIGRLQFFHVPILA